MRRVFLDDEGRLRSGWALCVYLVASVLLQVVFMGLTAALHLPIAPKDRIDDAALIPMAFGRLAAAVAGTWVGCLVVRQRLGDAWLWDARPLARFGGGLALGAFALSAAVLLTWALGQQSLHVSGGPAGRLMRVALVDVAVLVPVSVSEEFFLRGFLLQQLGRLFSGLGRVVVAQTSPAHPDVAGAGLRLGNWGAVLLSGILFGLMHGANPNVTRFAVINIMLVGVWFGAVVLKTGSLWVPMGLHTGWNWFQGYVWGEPVSGLQPGTSLLESTATGRELWTGGAFGPEASASASLVLGALLVATLLWRPKARGVAPAHAV